MPSAKPHIAWNISTTGNIKISKPGIMPKKGMAINNRMKEMAKSEPVNSTFDKGNIILGKKTFLSMCCDSISELPMLETKLVKYDQAISPISANMG